MKAKTSGFAVVLLPLLGMACGCHSRQIDTTVENRTGDAITLLEVDYPSASFGTDSLAAGADYHYRFQVRGNGPLKAQYTERKTLQVRQITGPELAEGQEGRLEIVLLPGGQAAFHPSLSPER
ncbi:MAG: hypothetical protein KGM96_00155 [Acidobacteriota bacterium]|nr:hypothetical protein [Acidobacteriota bacterium]